MMRAIRFNESVWENERNVQHVVPDAKKRSLCGLVLIDAGCVKIPAERIEGDRACWRCAAIVEARAKPKGDQR
jgi:hypothetical protein